MARYGILEQWILAPIRPRGNDQTLTAECNWVRKGGWTRHCRGDFQTLADPRASGNSFQLSLHGELPFI